MAKEKSVREGYHVYLNPEIMKAFKKYCIDKGMKTCQVMEQMILERVKEK